MFHQLIHGFQMTHLSPRSKRPLLTVTLMEKVWTGRVSTAVCGGLWSLANRNIGSTCRSYDPICALYRMEVRHIIWVVVNAVHVVFVVFWVHRLYLFFRVLWRGLERHHCVHGMLPSWQQLPRLPLPDGKSLSVRLYGSILFCVFLYLALLHTLSSHFSSDMWWAVWRCWSRRITWSSTWTEERPGVKCPASAGWRSAIRWSTEGMETVISFMKMHFIEEFRQHLEPSSSD